jgi:acyl carrier protein
MTENEGRIRKVVFALSEKQDPKISPEENLFDSGILDSFGLTDLVSALEKEFGVRIPDSDLRPANFASIQAIDSYLARKTSVVR